MINISKLLEKFSKKIDTEESCNRQVIEIIKKLTDLNINLKDCEIKNNVIYVNSSPAVKNKLFVYREQIVNEVNKIRAINVVAIR